MNPFTELQSRLDMLFSGLLLLIPLAAALAIGWKALEYYSSKNAQERGEFKESMVRYSVVAIIAMVADGAIIWFIG